MHRPLSRTYTVTGPTVPTPNKCFVYDAAIDGNTVANAKSRLAEAYTTTSACSQTTLPSSITTDTALGYSARGEVTDTYELTPHSGSGPSYNHTTTSFWLSGALNTLGGPAMPTLTYGVDTEGRTSTVSASGSNPVTSTIYSPYNNPPQQKVTFGSGDSDVFSFDANTFRLTQYQFNVGSQTVTGALNWNANGSLGSLNITDPFSTANAQNCSYTADDLARISQVSCPTIWGQNFTYDSFGNIQQSAISGENGTTFAPCYQTSPSITNRIAYVGGTGSNCTNGTAPSYDANGNSLNDTFRTFTWDAENRPVTIGSVSLTYDALGRMAEQSVSSTNTEIVYTPLGGKLALMNGTSLIKAFAPLTGGATAVYNSSGLYYYRHTDHLGSSRLASTATQTQAPYSETAYSPFGEPYASSGAVDPSFTGQNQDTLSGLYDFMYREHDPYQARWTQPDPAGLAAVDPTNPQSWNRYAYVLNNPLTLIDPSGMDDCVDGHYDCTPTFFDEGTPGDIYSGLGDLMQDPAFDCGWADFWGGDCGIERMQFLHALGLIDEFDIMQLAFAPPSPDSSENDPFAPPSLRSGDPLDKGFQNFGLLSLLYVYAKPYTFDLMNTDVTPLSTPLHSSRCAQKVRVVTPSNAASGNIDEISLGSSSPTVLPSPPLAPFASPFTPTQFSPSPGNYLVMNMAASSGSTGTKTARFVAVTGSLECSTIFQDLVY